MYLTYTSDQVPLISGTRPSDLKQGGGDFQPTYLVRVEDMKRVPGTEAKEEGYCTLSYSWNYSGDIEFDAQGESFYIDRRQHKIIVNENGWFQTQQEVKHVTFEDVIQQICKDFEIKYIWYDKMCIDQNDKVAKHHEIKQMHKIYHESNFTVALIPELHVPDTIKRMDWTRIVKFGLARMFGTKEIAEMKAYVECMQAILNSEWSKRVWTLEEAFMARKLVYVGSNAYLWSGDNRLLIASSLYDLVATTDPSLVADLRVNNLLLGKESPTAHATLFQAHQRTTTKSHDRVFALSHIVAHQFDVEINYDLPIEHVIRHFYSSLAEADLTILCFGKSARTYRNTIRGLYDLPSWTGVEGTHARELDIYRATLTKKSVVSREDQMLMHIQRCAYTKITPSPASEDTPQLDGITPESFHGLITTHYVEVPKDKCSDKIIDIVLPTSRTAYKYHNLNPGIRTLVMLSLTEECDECILLDSPFVCMRGIIFPVVRQRKDDTFKSIGIAYLRTELDSWTTGVLPKITLADAFETDESSFFIA